MKKRRMRDYVAELSMYDGTVLYCLKSQYVPKSCFLALLPNDGSAEHRKIEFFEQYLDFNSPFFFAS